MRFPTTVLTLLMIAVLAAFVPPAAAQRTVGTELWASGGFFNPDYNDAPLAVGRGGLGMTFLRRVGVGGSVQVDRDHWFGFGYAGIRLPRLAFVDPVVRFYMGRREDVSDTATGWSVSFGVGRGTTSVFIEAFGILEPGNGTGAAMGFSF